jgi:hypothetical protein
MKCYGCGKHGHQMDFCPKLEMYVNRGIITKRAMERIHRSNSALIGRELDEIWADAIARGIRRDREAMDDDKEQPKVYLIKVARSKSNMGTTAGRDYDGGAGRAL